MLLVCLRVSGSVCLSRACLPVANFGCNSKGSVDCPMEAHCEFSDQLTKALSQVFEIIMILPVMHW